MARKRTGRGSKMGAGAKKSREARKTGKKWLTLPAKWSFFSEEANRQYKIDVLPYVVKKVKQHPEYEAMQEDVWFRFPYKLHRNVGPKRQAMLCPETAGKLCPICERMREMYNDPDVSNKKAGKLVPAKRSLFIVKIKAAKDKKLVGKKYIWDISDANFYKEVDKEIEMGKDDWNNFACLQGGYTIKVRFAEESFDKTKYAAADRIDFVSRKDYPEKILDKNPCLDDMVVPNIPEYEDILKEFKGGKSGKKEKAGKEANSANLTYDDIEDMGEDELLEVMEDLGEDVDDLEYSDEEELRELVASELEIEKDDDDDDDDDDDSDDDEDDDDNDDEDDDDDDDDDDEESLEEQIGEANLKGLKNIIKENSEFKKLKKKLKEFKGKKGRKKLEKLMLKALKKEGSSSSSKCPHGYKFGEEWGEEDECTKDDCKLYQKCFKAYDKLQED